MAIIRWDPFTALARMDTEFDDLVRRAWGNEQARTTGWVPAIDMVRDGGDVVITLELPGLHPEDVDIEVREGRLVISGERRDEHEERSENGAKVLVRELRFGSFRREFALPEHVTANDVDAEYDKGLLRVRVSNVTKAAPAPQKIQVKHVQQAEAVPTGPSGDEEQQG